MKNQTMSLISASSPKSPCGGFRGRKGLFLVFCILGITAHIYGQTDSTGSSVSSVVSVKALPTIPSDSIKAQGRPDSLPVASIALDTAHKTDTMGQAQYQATLPVMRRDVSQGISGQTASPVQQREKFVAPKDTVKPRPNREIVQVFAKNYRLDGQDNIKDPVGMQGVRLEVDAHIVTASLPHLRNLDSALDKVEIIPNRHTVSSLAAAEAVLSRQQKESGTLLLDIGAGTTNLVVIEEGEIQHVAVLPIGGINITNDLAIGLKTDLDIAEEVKVKCATLDQDHKKEAVSVELNKKVHTFKTSDILMITEARIDELLDYVDKELRMIHRSRKLPAE